LRRLSRFLSGLALSAVACCAAFAEPVADPWFDGLYAGFGAGIVAAPGTVRQPGGRDSINLGDFGASPGTTGYEFIGYGLPYRGFVFGLEGEIAVHEAKGTVDPGPTTGLIGDYLWSAGLRGLVGYPVGRVMPFVSLGVTMTPAHIHAIRPASDGDVKTLVGWTAGAGLDVMLTRGIGLRAEYVFADFGEERFRVETGTPTDVDLTSHTFRAALVFRETEG
jgi:outer membrane immunogenic protein